MSSATKSVAISRRSKHLAKFRAPASGPADHIQAWTDALAVHQSEHVDALGSIREEAINHILSQHFEYDKSRYTLAIEQTFDAGGKERKFKVVINANEALKMDLPPFSVTDIDPDLKRRYTTGVWRHLEPPPASSVLTSPRIKDRKKDPTPDIRLFCPSVSLHIEWPKLDGSGTWSWDPPPIAIIAEAILMLIHEQEGPLLHIQLLRVKFDPAKPFATMPEFENSNKELPSDKQKSTEDDKFNDLLVIALNIAATTYAPKLVKDIRLPVPMLATIPIVPTLLEIKDKAAIVGVTVDRPLLDAQNMKKVDLAFATLKALIAEDIAEAGGLETLVLSKNSSRQTLVFKNERDVSSIMHRTSAFVANLERENKRYLKPPKRNVTKASEVPHGVGVAINQWALTKIAAAAMPRPVDDCTDWQPVLELVKGRVCWWLHVFNPVVNISGVTVSGQVSVDIGGAIEACVRKFWDCSWTWECGQLSLAIVGRPGIQLQMTSGSDGVSFYGQLIGDDVQLDTNLPFPFKDVVSFFSRIIAKAIIAMINLVVGNIKTQIVVPEFALPEQATRIKFSEFTPFPFIRTQNFPPDEKTFIAFDMGVSAIK